MDFRAERDKDNRRRLTIFGFRGCGNISKKRSSCMASVICSWHSRSFVCAFSIFLAKSAANRECVFIFSRNSSRFIWSCASRSLFKSPNFDRKDRWFVVSSFFGVSGESFSLFFATKICLSMSLSVMVCPFIIFCVASNSLCLAITCFISFSLLKGNAIGSVMPFDSHFCCVFSIQLLTNPNHFVFNCIFGNENRNVRSL
mmetsp:Transcript_9201/g.13620  ORF Transcript_9201/g.13620 Transcript_9201/m.13620 type:complete len:200 (-) Transcript_9201:1029-1628(-)